MGRNRTNKRQAAAPAPEFSAAGRKVLEIYELLYCICTHVDIETLFNAQRVSKRWHQIISTSSVLQQNLYLQSCPSSDLKQERVFNPLLLKHFEPILRRGEKYHFDEGCLDYSSLTVPGMSMTRMKGGRKVHKAFVRCGASWRRMLVAQPPITAIGYGVDVNDEEQDCRVLRFPDGLRMGVLYDMVFQAIFLNPVEAERHCYLELYVPPYGSSNVAMKEMTEKLGQRPGLLFTTASNYYENLAREITSGDFSIPELAVKSDYLDAMKESVRGRKGTRWMFQCEEFEETDYLSLGIEFLKKQA